MKRLPYLGDHFSRILTNRVFATRLRSLLLGIAILVRKVSVRQVIGEMTRLANFIKQAMELSFFYSLSSFYTCLNWGPSNSEGFSDSLLSRFGKNGSPRLKVSSCTGFSLEYLCLALTASRLSQSLKALKSRTSLGVARP
jgi:hypothetical protein